MAYLPTYWGGGTYSRHATFGYISLRQKPSSSSWSRPVLGTCPRRQKTSRPDVLGSRGIGPTCFPPVAYPFALRPGTLDLVQRGSDVFSRGFSRGFDVKQGVFRCVPMISFMFHLCHGVMQDSAGHLKNRAEAWFGRLQGRTEPKVRRVPCGIPIHAMENRIE